jgi:hypothetical protein
MEVGPKSKTRKCPQCREKSFHTNLKRSFFELVEERVATLTPGHRFHDMAAALIVKIKARKDGNVCNAANEEELEFIEFVVFGVLKDDDDSGYDDEQDDSDEWEQQQGADDDGNDVSEEASSPPSSGEGVEHADVEDQEANEEAQRGLYIIHERPVDRKSGTSLLDYSCSHPKTHTKQHAPPSGLTTEITNLGANFLCPFEERYPAGMKEKNPRFFTRTCTLGMVWACEMLCWRRTLLVAEEEEKLGYLGIYTKFGHAEIFGLTRPETASASECDLYDTAVKKVLGAWDSARVECGFN